MLELPLQPAVFLIKSTLTPSLYAFEVAACLVLCAVNTVTSIPQMFRVAFIHLLIVCEVTCLNGFLMLIKRVSILLRNVCVVLIYASNVSTGQISGRSRKRGRMSSGCDTPARDVLIRDGILIRISLSVISMFETCILDRVCTL